MDTLLAYLNKLSIDGRDVFARDCGTSIGYLRKACSINQKIGADLCIKIERSSGGVVRCEDLRPDVDWGYLRATNCPTVGADTAATETHQEAAWAFW